MQACYHGTLDAMTHFPIMERLRKFVFREDCLTFNERLIWDEESRSAEFSDGVAGSFTIVRP